MEEHEEVGRPLTCAGLVTPRTLELAGVSPDIVIRRITGARVHVPEAPVLALEGAGVKALVIDRVRLDVEMAQQAQQAGAELLVETKAVGVERSGGVVVIRIQRKAQTSSLRARLVVGADGPKGGVARCVGLASPPESIVCVTSEVRLRSEPEDAVRVFVGRGQAPGWFGWVIPALDGWARVGLGTANGASPAPLLRNLVETFPEVFKGVKMGRLAGGVIGLGMASPLYADNVMLVGGAAGQVKPTSGGGVYLGLKAARHCARTAIEALGAGDVSAGFLARYAARWEEDAGREFRRGLELRRAFVSLNDREFRAVTKVLRNRRLQELATHLGDIDYPSHLFSRLLKGTTVGAALLGVSPALWPRALALAWRLRGLR